MPQKKSASADFSILYWGHYWGHGLGTSPYSFGSWLWFVPSICETVSLFQIVVTVLRQFGRKLRDNFDNSVDTIPHLTISGAKIRKKSDICKKKSKIFGSEGDFCVSVVSRSSLGCESVESWRSGEGDGNELTDER